MSDTSALPSERRLHWLVIPVIAVMVGVLGGLLFSIRDAARVVLRNPAPAKQMTYMEMLSFGLYAARLYAVIGAALMLVVGFALALLAASRRLNLRGGRLSAVAAGIFAFVFLGVLFLAARQPLATGLPGRAFALADACLIGLLCAIGLAALVGGLGARLRSTRRLAALVVGAVPALFLVANWGLWLYVAALPGRPRAVVWLGELAIAVVASGIAAGLYVLLAPAPAGRRIARRRLLGAALLAGAALTFAVAHFSLRTDWMPSTTLRTSGAGSRPNVIWIVMDTARADAISCYGSAMRTTPNVDALAAQGAIFERAIAPAPWTLPSHAAMFTGLLPSANRTTAERQHLEGRFTTLAEVLAQHGYVTLGYSNNPYVGPVHNLAQGFLRFDVYYWGRTWRALLLANQFRPSFHLGDYGARDTNDTVKRWIARCAAASRPFFLFINYMEPHAEYGITPFFRRWLDGTPPAQALRVNQNTRGFNARAFELSAQERAMLRALYLGDVTYLDFRIGQLTEHLRELGILDNTLLIITSDHGEHFGEHGLRGHDFSLYNELLHVPLIIRHPASFPPGTRVRRVVSLIDIFPTVLDVAGVDWEKRASIQGRSLLAADNETEPALAVSEYAWPVHVILDTVSHHLPFDATPYLRRLKCIQSDEAKYVWASDGRHELYDLRQDPRELVNLVDALPERAAELKALLDAATEAGPPGSIPPSGRRTQPSQR